MAVKLLPTFCHGNKVKPLKIWKKITKSIVRLTRERKEGRKKKLFCKEIYRWRWFPANPSQIPPTFCHGNKVKPWEIWKKNYQIYRSFDEKGRKKLFCKEIAKKWWNLKVWVISSQILPTFCHGNKVKPWKLKKKDYQIYRSFDEEEEEKKKKAVLQKKSKSTPSMWK